MDSGSSDRSSLAAALQRYIDARAAALLEARRVLRINELDARALLFIAANPGTRPGTLSNFLGITSAGVTTLIDRLVERGAVRRDVDPADRRVNRITVTIELTEAPWSALTRFDDAFTLAEGAGDQEAIRRFATLLDGFTEAAAGRRA
ncbi:MarR family winged helix-turn-helix transcriptional regulator [Agromyces aurantiacus]|uniref:MarR family winged helix-turn-helix transcriptional regulator n=1 Tax=Agromyces aurantiacus TaxID=165814 RepID=A0ABV9R3S1_9MICO|nr:MarR family transcriptional regulator [Agromyces aurantiacus]MBM7503096.1 DNA-binding MarR family transcriptional regulator [Agromyces aurantiacus]